MMGKIKKCWKSRAQFQYATKVGHSWKDCTTVLMDWQITVIKTVTNNDLYIYKMILPSKMIQYFSS